MKHLADRIRKKAVAVAAAAVAAAAVFGALLAPQVRPDPAILPETPPAVVQMLEEPADAPLLPADSEAEEARKKRLRRQSALARVFSAAQAVLSFLVTAAVRILTFLATALVTRLFGFPAATLAAFLGEWLVTFLLMLLLFAWLFHRLFPGRKLSEFLTLRNLLILLFGSLAISLLRQLLPLFSGVPYAVLTCVDSFFSVFVFAACYLLLSRTRIPRAVLRSRPVAFAFCLVLLTALVTAAVRILLPAAAAVRSFLAFTACFLLCFCVCAAIAALRKPLPGPAIPAEAQK